jgi:hypothetical protein
MTRNLLTLVAVSLLVVVPACDSEAPDPIDDRTPGITLQRVGTIGGYPSGETVVVNVDAEGILTVRGMRMSLATLQEYLLERAADDRSPEPPHASRVSVVLRMDRTLPWGVAQWIMRACVHPDARMHRIHFAVFPEEGREEGALATHLPSDRTWSRVSIKTAVLSTGPGFDPAVLYSHVKACLGHEPTLPCEVNGDRFVPVGDMLRVVDICHRAGVDDVMLTLIPWPTWPEPIADLVREARSMTVEPTVSIFGEAVDCGPERIPALPPVVRVRGGLAGTFSMKDGRSVVCTGPVCGPGDWRADHRNLRNEGGEGTEGAVDAGLDWLARHQNPEGYWDCDGFEAQCETGKCGGPGYMLYDPGVTGLALLAFLGAGEHHKWGRHRKTVRNGLEYLKAIQDGEGCFGPRTTDRFIYNHGAAALAMVEAYALTGSPFLKQSAQNAVDFIVKCQNPGLAWRYGVRPKDNDTSVTGWMVMALKSAKEAGKLRVPAAGFAGAEAWLDKVTEPEYGKVGYDRRGNGPSRPEDIVDRFPDDRSEPLTAIGILSRIFMGEDPGMSRVIRKGTALCLKCPPRWDETDGSIDMYYWYFGSMAMFQVGGKPWKAWNVAMKDAILPHQQKVGCLKGSWDPVGPWGREGGRVYSTAMMTMCLEVYYRYERLFIKLH